MREHTERLVECLRTLRADPRSTEANLTLVETYVAVGHRAIALKCLRKLEALGVVYPGLRRLKESLLKSPPSGRWVIPRFSENLLRIEGRHGLEDRAENSSGPGSG